MQKIINWLKFTIPQIIQKTKDLILNPKEAWAAIASEEMTISRLFKEYLLILAAIPAIARFLGWGVFAFGAFLGMALLWYALNVLAVWGFAKLLTYLAPRFESETDDIKSLKLVVFSFLPVFITGIFYLIPLFGILTLAGGLYSIYLLYVGIPIVLSTPKGKALPFTVVAIILMILISTVIGRLTGGIWYPSIR